jgi:GNAT superfamily N-acetyltransferase
MPIEYVWRGDVNNGEVRALHADAFQDDGFAADTRDWESQLAQYSLGWVVAWDEGQLVGFVNVPWDGHVHGWIQDTMVASSARRQGIGTHLIQVASEEARKAGCQWLHVDFENDLAGFYYGSCRFVPTSAGLLSL